jgi:signal transduction histidine kinase
MDTPVLLVGSPSLQAQDWAAMVEQAHTHPGGLRWASSGVGSTGHLVMEQVRLDTQAPFVHVPYAGGGRQLQDALAGHFELLSTNFAPDQLTWLQQGRLKALALGAPTRHPMLPKLPTLSELGHPAANRWSTFGLFAPGTMSPALLQRLHDLLAEALGDDPEFGDDIRLLESEAARSRGILVRIAKRAEAEDPFAELGLDVLLHEVAQGVAPARVPVHIMAPSPQPMVKRSPELLHGLQNLVANAVRHAGSVVEIRAAASQGEVTVMVLDDGPGFSDTLLPQLGEPDLGPSHSGSGGTGLGIFIATTLLERTGGRLAFSNRRDGGARVDVRWLRSHIEAAQQE